MLPTRFRRPRLEPTNVNFPSDIDQVFDNMMQAWRDRDHDWGWNDNETAAYPCDIREENGRILVDAELPGFTREEVKVTLEKGVLSISAEHKEEKKKQQNGRNFLQERRYRRIQRSFTLPAAVNESKVDASLKDGVLHLALEKSKESMPHEIAIK